MIVVGFLGRYLEVGGCIDVEKDADVRGKMMQG